MALKRAGRLGCISEKETAVQGGCLFFLLSEKPFVTAALLAATARTLLRLRVCHFKLVAEEWRKGGPCLVYEKNALVRHSETHAAWG